MSDLEKVFEDVGKVTHAKQTWRRITLSELSERNSILRIKTYIGKKGVQGYATLFIEDWNDLPPVDNTDMDDVLTEPEKVIAIPMAHPGDADLDKVTVDVIVIGKYTRTEMGVYFPKWANVRLSITEHAL